MIFIFEGKRNVISRDAAAPGIYVFSKTGRGGQTMESPKTIHYSLFVPKGGFCLRLNVEQGAVNEEIQFQ